MHNAHRIGVRYAHPKRERAMKQIIPETSADYDSTRIIERPDGFYWQAADEAREYGPFATLVEAVADMQYRDDTPYEPGETVDEAEAEIGFAPSWVDPDTGQPGGGDFPRIEE
jgi:hypothetical protein